MTLTNNSNSRLDIDNLPLYCLEVFVLNTLTGYQIHLFFKAMFDVLGLEARS